MGSSASNLFASLFGNPEMRILMIGLDAAGKTTILYKLKLGEVVTTIPTVGFNVETIPHKNIAFTIWDVGSSGRIGITLRRHYYQNTQGVIFVVDSSDMSRIKEVTETLHDELNHDGFRNVPVLIFANKQDLPNALSVSQLVNRLSLHLVHQQWHIEASCAGTGDGLYEGLDWLAKACGNKPTIEAASDGVQS